MYFTRLSPEALQVSTRTGVGLLRSTQRELLLVFSPVKGVTNRPHLLRRNDPAKRPTRSHQKSGPSSLLKRAYADRCRGELTFLSTSLQNNFQFVCPFSRAKPLSPVKAVIKAAYQKEKLP